MVVFHHAQLQIAKLTDSVSYTIKADTAPRYRIDATATNLTADASNPVTIKENGTVTLKFTADGVNYIVPREKPTITGTVTSSWSRTSDTECTITLSNPSTAVSFTITALKRYTISVTATNITASVSNPTKIDEDSTVTLVFLADGTNYKVPFGQPLVTGADVSYARPSDTECHVKLSNPTSAVSFTINGLKIYSITANLSNLSAASTNASTITELSTATLTYTANGTTYKVPASGPTVLNATCKYTKVSDTTCTLLLSVPTGNVSFSLSGVAIPQGYTLTVETGGDGGKFNITYASGSTASVGSGTYYSVTKINSVSYNGTVDQAYNINDTPGVTLPYTLTAATNAYVYSSTSSATCFVKGTQITMADGSTKNVEDVTYGDELLCYDFYVGEQTTAPVDWVMYERQEDYYCKVTLADGTILNLAGPDTLGSHRLYNVTQQTFMYPQNFAKGDLTLKQDGSLVEITSYEWIYEPVKYYNLSTQTHINLYAEGVLTSNRLSNKYRIINNKYTDEQLMSDEEITKYLQHLADLKV